MAVMVEVTCPNEECPAREVTHSSACRCKGSERVPSEDGPGWEPCPEEAEVIPHRWMAEWLPTTYRRLGDWGPSIYCSGCGEEGQESP
jgi:hypothetical protein